MIYNLLRLADDRIDLVTPSKIEAYLTPIAAFLVLMLRQPISSSTFPERALVHFAQSVNRYRCLVIEDLS